MQRIRKFWTKLGLWPRMALGVSLGFLLLFAAFLSLGENILRESTDRLLKERLGFAQMAATTFDGFLSQAVAELREAREFADFDPDDPDLSAEAHALSHIIGQVGMFSPGALFLDERGRVLVAHPPELYPRGTDLSDRPFVVEALEGEKYTISAPFRAPLGNQPVVAVAIPVQEDGGKRGLLSGFIDLRGESIALSLQETASFAQTGHSLLVDRDGRVIVSTEPYPFLSPGEHATFYRKALSEGEPMIETVSFEGDQAEEHLGHQHVMAVAPLKMAPWGVAVGGDADEIFSGVSRLRTGLALLGGIVLIGIWAVTLIAARLLTRPVQRLTEGAQRIAAGDYSVSLQAPEGGEMGTLAEALDNMRTQLLAYIEELARSKATLEMRVAERTEALRQQQMLVRQLLRRAITAQEDERARISQELHDETGQTLTAVQINLDRLSRLLDRMDGEGREQLSRIQQLTEQALGDLRRIIADLRPGVLDQLGLVPALKWVADQTLEPLGVAVDVSTDGLQERLPGEIETILFRIAQEAVSNVARHSHAEHFTIRLEQSQEEVIMRLTDDGRGFNPLTVSMDPEFERGLGLASMQERASLAGGKVTVESAPRRGTTVHVVVPLHDAG